MDASDIHEHKIAGANVFFCAPTYGDDPSSAAAYARARAKISGMDDTSLFRVKAPADGPQLLLSCAALSPMPGVSVSGLRGEVWSTAPRLTRSAIASRFRDVADAAALNSTASWGGVGDLASGPEGSRGPSRRPHG